MTPERLHNMLLTGETVAVEFKRCSGNIESDVYETVCSFLNRFGGDIILGVSDKGEVEGVSKNAAPNLVKNFVSTVSNPNLFAPATYIEPQIIEYQGKTLIVINVPTSGEVHTYKKVVYDRYNDSDIKVTSTAQIAQMYIRKHEIYTERKVFPYIEKADLRTDLLPRLRIIAANNAGGTHPWMSMTDDELFKSARLYIQDPATGQKGFNLAAAMLLGKDETVLNVCPAYVTDALVRKVNIDRYDDREIVQTNLIESFTKLFDFAVKHLPDKFYVEDAERKSLRNIIVREMISNTLMHREFSSAFQAKFVIEKDKMYVENANRAKHNGDITPDNLEPYPKNPIIASFFRTIKYADQLGSGVRKMFRYTKLYSGSNPTFSEGDVFKITAPLDELYSFDADKVTNRVANRVTNKVSENPTQTITEGDTEKKEAEKVADRVAEKVSENPTQAITEGDTGKKVADKVTNRVTNKVADKVSENPTQTITKGDDTGNKVSEKVTNKVTNKVTENQAKILEEIEKNPDISQEELSNIIGISRIHITKNMGKLQEMNILQRVGGRFGGQWKVINKDKIIIWTKKS